MYSPAVERGLNQIIYMKTENITRLTLEINPIDILTTRYINATDCAITRALGRAGRPDLVDVGLGIRTSDWTKRFDHYNIKGYEAMSKHVKRMYKAKKNRRADWKSQEFVLELNESVYVNAHRLPIPQWFAKLKQLFNKNK